MSIGLNIKHFRNKRGLTQTQLAIRAKLSRSYLADVEGDRYNPSVEMLKAIAEALGINTYELLGEKPPMPEVNPAPDWATPKDKRDFKKMLEEDGEIMFDGIPIDEVGKQRIKDVLTGLFWEAKEINKKKYGKKKDTKTSPDDDAEK